MTLGKYWNDSIAPAVKQRAGNKQVLLDGLAACEATAKDFFNHLKASELRSGIHSCIANGSDSLGLPAPNEVAPTEAFAEFRSWAKSEGLKVKRAKRCF